MFKQLQFYRTRKSYAELFVAYNNPYPGRICPTSHIDTYFFKIHLNIVLPSPVFFHIVSILT